MMPLDVFRWTTPQLGAAAPAAPWIEQRLRALFETLSIETASRFSFAGSSFELGGFNPMLDTSKLVEPGTATATQAFFGFGNNPLVECMWQVIYNYCYARDFAGKTPNLPTGKIEPRDFAFVAKLRTANRSRPRWDCDWTAYKLEAGGVIHIEKAGNRRLAKPGEYALPLGHGRPIAVGDRVSLQCASDSLDVQPGFYFTFGETVASDHDDAHLARFYFHVPPDQVPWLLTILTQEFNRFRIPYRIKCLANPVLYERNDPMVLYVAKRFLNITLRLLSRHRCELEQRLLSGVPLCSKPLLDGLGVADEPGNGRSFGQTRSYIFAQAILDAFADGNNSVERRFEFASRRFSQLGLSITHPHLGEGAFDLYEFPKGTNQERHTYVV